MTNVHPPVYRDEVGEFRDERGRVIHGAHPHDDGKGGACECGAPRPSRGKVITKSASISFGNSKPTRLLEAYAKKYAPDPNAFGYVEFSHVIEYGVLDRLDRYDEWRDVPEEMRALNERAAGLSRDWGFREPSVIIPILWRDDPLLKGVPVTPWPYERPFKGLTDRVLPRVHRISLRAMDGERRSFDELYEILVHEFLHRVQISRPTAFDVVPGYRAGDYDEGHCTRAIQELAPVMARLHATTPRHDREIIDELQAACVRVS